MLAHGYVMNGGVLHAIAGLSPDTLRAACAGYRYFGFDSVADLLATGAASLSERAADDAYHRWIASDSVIGAAFSAHRARSPESYAPTDGDTALPHR
jgi:hypothetical protein